MVDVTLGNWTSTAINDSGIYSCRFHGESDYCFFVFDATEVKVLADSWFTLNNSVQFKVENNFLSVYYRDNSGTFEFNRITM